MKMFGLLEVCHTLKGLKHSLPFDGNLEAEDGSHLSALGFFFHSPVTIPSQQDNDFYFFLKEGLP